MDTATSQATLLCNGRFQAVSAAKPACLGARFDAQTMDSRDPVSVLAIDPTIAAGTNLDVARAALQRTSQLDHGNLIRPIELCPTQEGIFVVSDLVTGQPLRELLDRRKTTNTSFAAQSAQNIILHLCKGLEALHAGGSCHGFLSLDTIYINKAGRVELADLGLSSFAAQLGRQKPSTTLAPEVRVGAPATPASDIYSVGAVLYELLVGTAPSSGCKRPSEVNDGLNPLVDEFVAGCMQVAPEKRPRDIKLVYGAAQKALASQSAKQPSAHPVRTSLAQSIAAPRTTGPIPTEKGDAALAHALADDYERWLVSKGKLDYGPFALADVVKQIQSDEILPEHSIVDNETGVRVAVEDHPLLVDLVDKARQKRDDKRRAQAEVATVKQDKRRGTTLYAVVAVLVLGLGGGTYALVSALGSDDKDDSASIAGLDEGSLQAKITFPAPTKKKRRRGTKRRKNGTNGVGGGWDDSMDLDMENDSGGSERLDPTEINPVIQRHGGKLGRCLRSTRSRSASIDFIVKGTGKVSQVRVNGETKTPLANCVRKAMLSMQFPKFNGTRTKANFDMSI